LHSVARVISFLIFTACVAAYAVAGPSKLLLGYGAHSRAVVIALHSGRIALVYHSPSFLDGGWIVGSEDGSLTARNFLLPYVQGGRRAIISIPLYFPLVVFAVAALQPAKQAKLVRGFAIVSRPERQPACPHDRRERRERSRYGRRGVSGREPNK
jgi:hypothetical protein